jgi:hypothetical protein
MTVADNGESYQYVSCLDGASYQQTIAEIKFHARETTKMEWLARCVCH